MMGGRAITIETDEADLRVNVLDFNSMDRVLSDAIAHAIDQLAPGETLTLIINVTKE